jgi:hypothetical protein
MHSHDAWGNVLCLPQVREDYASRMVEVYALRIAKQMDSGLVKHV